MKPDMIISVILRSQNVEKILATPSIGEQSVRARNVSAIKKLLDHSN